MDKTDFIYKLKLYSILVGQGMFAVMLLTWFAAFMNPSDTVRVTINMSGEKTLEYITIPLAFAFAFWGSYLNLRDFREKGG